MIVTDLAAHSGSSHVELAATVKLQNSLPANPDPRTGEELSWSSIRLWYRMPIEIAGGLSPVGDPFLAALLPLAVWAREDQLVLDCPVSAVLLEQSQQLVELLSAGLRLSPELRVNTTCLPYDPPTDSRLLKPKRASFFSGGVDSFYTVLKHLGDRRGWITPLSDLILIQSDAVHATPVDSDLYSLIQDHVHTAADHLGLRLHTVETNLSEIHNRYGAYSLANPSLGISTDRIVINHVTLGSALWSVATGLQHEFQQILIPSHYSYAAGNDVFHMSSPLTDPLWSTNLTQVVHDGAEATRLEKILRCVAGSQIALQHLNVCWYNTQSGRRIVSDKVNSDTLSVDTPLNCGHCEKCMRTQFELSIANAEAATTLFPQFDVDACVNRICNFRGPLSKSQLNYYTEMQSYLKRNAARNAKLCDAIDEIIATVTSRGMSDQVNN